MISADNYYNPFGVDFGDDRGGNGQPFLHPLHLARPARGRSTTPPPTRWWRASKASWATPGSGTSRINYGHIAQTTRPMATCTTHGLRDALGPSFLDPADGVVKCGTPGDVDRQLHAAEHLQHRRSADGRDAAPVRSVNPIFIDHLRAEGLRGQRLGRTVQHAGRCGAAGLRRAWRREYQRSEVDYVAIANADGTCLISQEACGSPVTGSFSVGELYAELFLPLLKDVPFAKALERDPRLALLELQQLRQHRQQQAAGRMASDRRPAVPRHRRRGVPRAEHQRPVRRSGRQRAAGCRIRCVGYDDRPSTRMHGAACGPRHRRHQHPGGRHRAAGGLAS